jgi:uncharacterized FlgJ-related protein
VAGRTIILLQISITFLLFACRPARHAVTPVSVSVTAEDYINKYKDLAVMEMKRTGVPASITLAQGMVESNYGRSTLARSANNHFGIKCHSIWKGQRFIHHDDRRNECFRKYANVEDSFRDHSDFLRSGSRYSFLFDLNPSDYKGWAHGLKKAGYATNPDYANMLIRKIEEHNLYYYDRDYRASSSTSRPAPISTSTSSSSSSSSSNQTTKAEADTNIKEPSPAIEETSSFGAVLARASRIMTNNGVQYVIVKDGEKIDDIAREFKVLKWEIVRYNELTDKSDLIPGQILYLQAKKDRSETGAEFHIAREGETIYMISQKYGIRLKSLLDLNRMQAGEEPSAGQKIWLKDLKPVDQ